MCQVTYSKLQTVLVLLCVFCLTAWVSATVVIDDFTTSQKIGGSTTRVNGTDMIGGQREARVRLGFPTANINESAAGQLYCRGGDSYDWLVLTYDGVDDASDGTNYQGLGHQDLTDGGTQNGLVFNFTEFDVAHYMTFWVTLRQGAGVMSHAYISIDTAVQSVFLPFDEFNTEPWLASDSIQNTTDSETMIDFTDVGYMYVEITAPYSGTNFALDSITTGYEIPEPVTLMLLSLGGLAVLRKRRKL